MIRKLFILIILLGAEEILAARLKTPKILKTPGIVKKGILTKRCELKESDIAKMGVYAIKNKGNYEALHTDFIDDTESYYLFCATKQSIPFKCVKGVMKSRGPRDNCKKRVKASVTDLGKSCAANGMTGNLYRVRYILDTSEVTLYEACYSKNKEAVLYTVHRAYGFQLTVPKYKRPAFTLDRVVSRARVESFKRQNIYEQFEKLYGPGQKYVETNTTRFDRGHLANSQDFLTYDQMNETFKYVNVMPQFIGSNRGNWKRIENWIHKFANPEKYALVVTGIYGVLELLDKNKNPVKAYLMDGQKNPVPLWTYKVVKYNAKCYAFVTLNNDENKNTAISTNICRGQKCPLGLNFDNVSGKGVSYCCDYDHFVKSVGDHVKLC